MHLFRLWIECAFYTPFAFLFPLDTEHVSLVLPWIAQRMFNTIQYNTYTNSLRAYTISSAYFAIFSKVEKAPPFFFTCSMTML